jgi:lipid A 4'-phosphatase
MGIMTGTDPRGEFQDQRANSNVSLLVWSAVVVGVAAGFIFSAFPEIDLRTSGFFYMGHGVFSGKGGGIFSGPPTTVADFIRLSLYVSFVGVCVVAAAGIAISLIRKRNVLGLVPLKWIFLGACLILGPGIVGNVILKDHWGRARPVHIVEFGGTKTYSLALVPSDQCNRNCSFVAGEASMMYAAFFAAAFLFPIFGRRLILAGVLMGLFSGFIRISQGAHFLSDVIFAGVTMALTVAGVYVLFRAISNMCKADADAPAEDPLARRSLW